LHKKNTEKQLWESALKSRSYNSMSRSVNYIGELKNEWENFNDIKKIEYLGNAESEVLLTLELMAASGTYLQSIKDYKDDIVTMKHRILKQDDSNLQKNYIEELYDDIKELWVFLINDNFQK